MLLLILAIFIGCSTKKDALLSISKIEKKRDIDGTYYQDVSINNRGEMPALFVILIGNAYSNGKIIQTVEKGFGDIYPNETKTFPLFYQYVGHLDPDSVNYSITYSQSDNSPIR